MAIDKWPRVTISAGHGEGSRVKGKSDPGAEVVAYDGTEDDLVLNAAKSVYNDLRILFAAKKRGDVFLRNAGHYSLADDFAVAHDSDVFVELHTDSAGAKASGTSVLYGSDYSKAFAEGMATRVSGALGIKDRGANLRTDLAVIKPHRGLKSILIELFFGSNKNDVAAWKKRRDAAIIAIVNGILKNRGWRELKKRPSKMTKLALKLYKPF